jgi:hypothetical protein
MTSTAYCYANGCCDSALKASRGAVQPLMELLGVNLRYFGRDVSLTYHLGISNQRNPMIDCLSKGNSSLVVFCALLASTPPIKST